jgi:hypothetical protein
MRTSLPLGRCIAAVSLYAATATFGGAAAAAEPMGPPRWTGVDLTLVEGLSPARVDGYSSGFTADFKGGLVRVYVMPSEVAASWWVARMAKVAEKQKPEAVPLPPPGTVDDAPPPLPADPTLPPPPPKLPTADELLVAGDRLVIARVDNVGVMVEIKSGARDWAEQVLATLTDDPLPWPTVPPLQHTGAGWSIPLPPEGAVRYQGGQRIDAPGLRFRSPPSLVVVYDTHGRASRQAYDPLGLPIDQPPPWADFPLAERTPAPPEQP